MFTIEFPIYPKQEEKRLIDNALKKLTLHYNNVAKKLTNKYDYICQTKEYKACKTKGEKYEVLNKYNFNKFGFQEYFQIGKDKDKNGNYIGKKKRYYSDKSIINSVVLQNICFNLWAAFDKVINDWKGKSKVDTDKNISSITFSISNNKLIGIDLDLQNTCFKFSHKKNITIGNKVKKIECNPIKFEVKTKYDIHALKNEIRTLTIVKKDIRGKDRYYVQFSIDDVPYNKCRTIGNGRMGVDPSQQYISTCLESNGECERYSLINYAHNDKKKIISLYRKLDRQRRANNKEAYNEDGTFSKYYYDTKQNSKNKKYPWKESKGYIKTLEKIKDLLRKEAVNKKINHNITANNILSKANDIIWEHNDVYKFAKRSHGIRKNDKGKIQSNKRYGKSIYNGAPSMLKEIIKNKLAFTNGKFTEISAFNACTQFDHTSQEFVERKIDERVIKLNNGDNVDRDFHAAMNVLFCTENDPQNTKKNGKNKDHFDLDKMNKFYEAHKTNMII